MAMEIRYPRKQAALIVGVKDNTLAKWASQGKGPRWHRCGGRVYYYAADLKSWLDAQPQGGGIVPARSTKPIGERIEGAPT
jgi:helix-turn-helix protein